MGKIYMGIIVPCTVIFPLLMSLFKYKYWNAQVRIIFIYIFLSAVFNIIAKITAYSNNLPYLHLYTILEFMVLCTFFKSLVNRSSVRLFLMVLMVLFPVISFGYILWEDSFYKFNRIPRFISSILITVMCMYFLLKDLGSVQSDYSMFLFTVITGLLLYYCTCSALFGLSNVLLSAPKNIATMIWNIHATFNLLMYLIFFRAFLYLKRHE